MDARWIPATLSIARLVCAPLVYLAIRQWSATPVLLLLATLAMSDVLDGWLARRLRATTRAGVWLDVVADFVLVLAAFTAFARREVHPAWLPVVMALMFAQFIVFSRRELPSYDPAGKYYAALLYATGGASFVFRQTVVADVILFVIVCLAALSFVGRGAPRWFRLGDGAEGSAARTSPVPRARRGRMRWRARR